MNYYNEIDTMAAAWIRELIAANLIPNGHVDTRSIADVQPKDLDGYCQCHFFCGISGWPLALQLAGWPQDEPVWSGSAPCQPFSSAGSQSGTSDERHLWPEFMRLIRACRPSVVFGEQVASALVVGSVVRKARQEASGDPPVWLDGISADLEQEGYAVGSVVLGAHSVGAPHIRQRLYWVANAGSWRREVAHLNGGGCGEAECARKTGELGMRGEPVRMADSAGSRCDRTERNAEGEARHEARVCVSCEVCGSGRAEFSTVDRCEGRPQLHGQHDGQEPVDGCESGGMGDADRAGREALRRERVGESAGSQEPANTGAYGGVANSDVVVRHRAGSSSSHDGRKLVGEEGVRGFWDHSILLPCRDGKARRTERKPLALADGVSDLLDALRHAGASEEQVEAALETFLLARNQPGRTMLLRGFGNAICVPTATAFVRAFMET